MLMASSKQMIGGAPHVVAAMILMGALSTEASMGVTAVRVEPPPRLIAIGDLHGDLSNAEFIFQNAGITDTCGRWVAENDVVIQLGDVVDRGPQPHEILDWFESLEKEAAAAGGEFTFLVGNHELLNLIGDHRYIHPSAIAAFGGTLEMYANAFSPTGAYGKYILSHPVAVVRHGILFVHAGIEPQYAALGVDRINADFRRNPYSFNSEATPLWSRGVILDAVQNSCGVLNDSLRLLSLTESDAGRPPVTHMVVGHTVQKDGRVGFLCDGRLVAADIAISSYMMNGGYIGFVEMLYEPTTHAHQNASGPRTPVARYPLSGSPASRPPRSMPPIVNPPKRYQMARLPDSEAHGPLFHQRADPLVLMPRTIKCAERGGVGCNQGGKRMGAQKSRWIALVALTAMAGISFSRYRWCMRFHRQQHYYQQWLSWLRQLRSPRATARQNLHL